MLPPPPVNSATAITKENKAKAISAELLELNFKNKLEETGKQDETGKKQEEREKQ